MRKLLLAALALVVVAAVAAPAGARTATPAVPQATLQGETIEYVVLYDPAASPDDARAAIENAGGDVVEENASLGTAVVHAPSEGFATAVAAEPSLDGAAPNGSIGAAPDAERPQDRERIERPRSRAGANAPAQEVPSIEPLAGLQWDMEAMDTRAAHTVETGDPRVLVGVMDTGVDGSHPDVAPNFDAARSRNFTVDFPDVDGACEEDPDGSCNDPADVDENGHGTHIAGTIASPYNGLGIAGVAPDVTLVNVRAGQDSGYFFLAPFLEAMTYSADIGVDVVNMSFYIDPWLYNCRDNPADSPEDQYEQRAIIDATQRALDYAHGRGVTLVAAEGNGFTDLGNPRFDGSSPDYPPDMAYPRDIDNSCLNLPTEGNHVIGVTSIGPSGRKAFYSDYGLEQADISAPGGDSRDYFGTPQFQSPGNLILSPYPEALAIENGEVNPDGTPNTPFVVRDCQQGVCAYYQYIQGTSMASPHAVGVAALIISQDGRRDRERGGLTMDPAAVEAQLLGSAVDTPCPRPRTFDYPDPASGPEYTAVCRGGLDRNGFYGDGIANAANAVGAGGGGQDRR